MDVMIAEDLRHSGSAQRLFVAGEVVAKGLQERVEGGMRIAGHTLEEKQLLPFEARASAHPWRIRDLPMPASPSMRMTSPCPETALSQHSAMEPSSARD